MPRHQHLLRKRTAAAYPSQLIAVTAHGEWEDTGARPTTQVMRLVSWHGVGCSGRGGVYGPDRSATGADADSLWRAVDARLAKGGMVWAFSPNATRTWGMLGLWDMIDDRSITLVGGDYRNGERRLDANLPEVPGERCAGHGGHVNQTGNCVPGLRRCADGTRAGAATGKHQRGKRRLGYVVVEDPPVIIDCRRGQLTGTLRIVDLANYGIPTAALGWDDTTQAAATMAFVRSMVGTLFSERLGSLKPTVSSQAMTSFLSADKPPVIQAHTDQHASGLEDRGYYGGRCEAFRLGALPGKIWHLDVTAMYPSLCASEDVPVCLTVAQRNLAPGQVLGVEAQKGAIADVTVATEEPCYPYKDARRGITIWPVGEFQTTLAGAELAHALREGAVKHIHAIAYYVTEPALRAYAEHMLRLRAETRDNAALNAWVKAMGNTLVGKFGQKDRRWVAGRSTGAYYPWSTWHQPNRMGGWDRWRSIGGAVQREEIGGWSYDAVPAIACFITAAARMRLLEMIRCAGWANVYYCDTDSLMVGNDGVARLACGQWIRPGKPGYLRIKAETERVVIHGVKDYDEGEVRVKAGVPLDGRRQLDATGTIWTAPTVGGHCHGRRKPEPERVAMSYTVHSTYRHGVRQKDGTVRPIRKGGFSGEL